MSARRYYGLRRVNPFLGVLQVVEVAGARALSPNGARWQVELLSDAAVRQPLWADIGPASSERRYFTYGVWSQRGGMRRLPVNPILGDQSGHAGLVPLVAALEALPAMPFPLADTLELWLLDRADRPLALLMTARTEHPPTLPYPPPWHPLPRGGASSHSGEADGAPPREPLEHLMRVAAGTPPRAQWFRRTADGGGTGLLGLRLGPELEGRCLPQSDFPELLVREDWSDPVEREAVDALIAWQAPLLLTLAELSTPTRARLEPLAARRAAVLYRNRRLIPRVIDRAVIDTALVEAVLRATA